MMINRQARRAIAKMKPDELEGMLAEAKDKGFHEGQAQILAIILAFLHIDKGYKRKNMREWLKQFDSFARSVNGYGKGSLAEIKRILIDECEFDFEKEFANLMRRE